MYKKVAITLFCLSIVLLSVSAFAQDDAIDEVVIDDASLEEVTTDSPTADIGLDQPADRDVTAEDQIVDTGVADPIDTEPVDTIGTVDTIDQTQTTQPVGDTTTQSYETTQAQSGRTYFDGVNTYANSQVLFKLRSTDNNVLERIMYSIDDTGEQTYASPFAIQDQGRHSIKYYGVDQIGNIENQKVFNVIIDNTAPAITVTSETPVQLINGRYYIAQNARVTINAQDEMAGVSSVKYTINGTDYQNYTTAFSFNALGDINFKVKAEDNVGNVSESYRMMLPDVSGNNVMAQNRNLTFYVDNEAPTVSISADRPFVERSGRQVAGTDYMYTITAQDADSGIAKILYRTDGQGAYRTYEQPFRLPNNGDHFIEAKAVDTVGNVSQIAILSIYVDVIPPNSNITTITEEGESQPQQ